MIGAPPPSGLVAIQSALQQTQNQWANGRIAVSSMPCCITRATDVVFTNSKPLSGALLCSMYYRASTRFMERMATVMHIWCDAAT